MTDDQKGHRNFHTIDTPSSVDTSVTRLQIAEKPAQDDVEAGMTANYSPTDPHNRIDDSSSVDEEDWDNDPENPRNWSSGKKWTAVAIASSEQCIGYHYHNHHFCSSPSIRLSLHLQVL
jgi:hypothetical protein